MTALKSQSSWQIDGQSRQNNLPDGYTELEYIETDGKSCINTNLMITGNESWECVFENAGRSNLETPVLGTLNGGSAFTDINNFSITYTTAASPNACLLGWKRRIYVTFLEWRCSYRPYKTNNQIHGT